jgi:hypothetical protein
MSRVDSPSPQGRAHWVAEQIFEGAGFDGEAVVHVPAVDFTFKTDPLETSKCDFAVMGDEVNGRYYETANR